MASLKDRIDKAVAALEKAQKAQTAAEAVRRYNTTVSQLAKNARDIKAQKSAK